MSIEQLTFKIVSRTVKGRRNTAAGKQCEMKDLFTY